MNSPESLDYCADKLEPFILQFLDALVNLELSDRHHQGAYQALILHFAQACELSLREGTSIDTQWLAQQIRKVRAAKNHPATLSEITPEIDPVESNLITAYNAVIRTNPL